MTIVPAAEYYARPDRARPEITHPEICDEPWCLAQPIIQRDGRVSHWVGAHRGDVQVIAAAYGTVIETSIACEEGGGANGAPGPAEIHLLLREVEGSSAHFEARLSPDEARSLARHLSSYADHLGQYPEGVYPALQSVASGDAIEQQG